MEKSKRILFYLLGSKTGKVKHFCISISWNYGFGLSNIFEIFRVNRTLFPSFSDVTETFSTLIITNVSQTLFNNLPFPSMIRKLTNLLHMNFKMLYLFGNEVFMLDVHAFQ